MFDFTDKPSPPQNLRVKDVNRTEVTIAWDAPVTDGGAPITAYVVEKRDAKRTSYVRADTTDGGTYELVVGKLVEGNEYIFQVSAENEIGTSEPATMKDAVKARLPFGQYWCYNI